MQLAVARQLLAAQRDQGIERRQFGVQQVALVAVEGFAIVLAGLEDAVDLLDARLAVADFGLGALGAGLGGDAQAVGVGQLLLQIALLGAALHQQLFELRHRQAGVALGHRHHFGAFEAGQFTGVFRGLAGCAFELTLEVSQALLVILLVAQQGQGLLQHILQRLHVGVGQFAVRQLVQGLLHALDAWRGGGIYGADAEGQTEQGSG